MILNAMTAPVEECNSLHQEAPEKFLAQGYESGHMGRVKSHEIHALIAEDQHQHHGIFKC